MKKIIMYIFIIMFCVFLISIEKNYADNKSISVVLNGTLIQFDQQPIIQSGRTLVPMRVVFEAIGAQVLWEPNHKTIIAKKGDTIIKLQIGSNLMVKNTDDISLDIAPVIVNGRTLVPLRAIAESFGSKVHWNSSSRIVEITDKKNGVNSFKGIKLNQNLGPFSFIVFDKEVVNNETLDSLIFNEVKQLAKNKIGYNLTISGKGSYDELTVTLGLKDNNGNMLSRVYHNTVEVDENQAYSKKIEGIIETESGVSLDMHDALDMYISLYGSKSSKSEGISTKELEKILFYILGESKTALNSDIIALLEMPLAANAFQFKSIEKLRPYPDYSNINRYGREEEMWLADIRAAATISFITTNKMIEACKDYSELSSIRNSLLEIKNSYEKMMNFSPTTYDEYEDGLDLYRNLTDNNWTKLVEQIKQILGPEYQ